MKNIVENLETQNKKLENSKLLYESNSINE